MSEDAELRAILAVESLGKQSTPRWKEAVDRSTKAAQQHYIASWHGAKPGEVSTSKSGVVSYDVTVGTATAAMRCGAILAFFDVYGL